MLARGWALRRNPFAVSSAASARRGVCGCVRGRGLAPTPHGSLSVEQCQNVARAGDQSGVVLADHAVASTRGRRGQGAGDCPETATESGGVASRIQGSRPPPRLGDDRHSGESRQDPVSREHRTGVGLSGSPRRPSYGTRHAQQPAPRRRHPSTTSTHQRVDRPRAGTPTSRSQSPDGVGHLLRNRLVQRDRREQQRLRHRSHRTSRHAFADSLNHDPTPCQRSPWTVGFGYRYRHTSTELHVSGSTCSAWSRSPARVLRRSLSCAICWSISASLVSSRSRT